MAGTLFHCDDALWLRFAALCAARDETPGAVLRDLVRRFRAGFPGHPRPGLAAQHLAGR